MRGWNQISLQMKLIVAFVGIVIVNLAISLYYTAQVREMVQFNQSAQAEYFHVRQISNTLQEAERQAARYIQSPDEEIFQNYTAAKEATKQEIAALAVREHTNAEWYRIHAMQNSTDTLFGKYDTAMKQLRAGFSGYYVPYYAGQKILKYVPGYINEYLNLLVERTAVQTSRLEQKTQTADRVSKSFLLGSGLVCLLFALAFSSRVTEPIRNLSEAAMRISRGELDVPDIPVISDDEMGALIRTFNVMKEDISIAIETLIERSELEGRLHREELKNLKNAELLKEAQYLALQSQINPHFLFNALNAISRAIAHEPSGIAVQLVCSLADLFRYNLDHLNTYSTLGEELDVVGKYIYIQKHRFEERVGYHMHCPAEYRDALVPSMLVQPLVENSLIHGIENLEHGGKIFVCVTQKKDFLRLRVYDNGVGIPPETRRVIGVEDAQKHTGHTTGIGLANIRQRLKLLPQSSMRIASSPGRGTLVEIRVPLRREGESDV